MVNLPSSSQLRGFFSFFSSTSPARVVGVLAGGTLGQRAVITLGLFAIAFALFKSLPWVAILVGGWVLCSFAVRDYERTAEEP